MRDTKYATLLRDARLVLGGGHEVRAERLFIKDTKGEELRFSWWKGRRLMPRPLDLTEDQWVNLFKEAVRQDVLTDDFKKKLIGVLSHAWL